MGKRLGLNGFYLKWIAIISMCLDHVGAVLFPPQFCSYFLR